MTKRSALTIAGGVVAAIAAGAFAIFVNLGVLRASETTSGPGKLRATEPIVRTVTDTVTIHKKGRTPHVSTSTGTVFTRQSSSSLEQENSDDDNLEGEEAQEHEYGEEDDD
jgi:hypothetical protein